jgi:hypothetical protein
VKDHISSNKLLEHEAVTLYPSMLALVPKGKQKGDEKFKTTDEESRD